MNVLFRFVGLPVGVAFAASLLLAQKPAVSAPDPLSPQEQSIASQMEAITSTGAQKQAESIRQQAESLRRQYGTAVWASPGTGDLAGVGTAAGPVKPAIAPVEEPKPVTLTKNAEDKEKPADGQAAPSSAAAEPKRAFYTTPWPASIDFEMPSVRVDTDACDALADSQVQSLVQDASAKNKVDPNLLRAVMVQESNLRPCAMSTAGAMGLMQIMPATADDLGLADPFDPAANVDAGARYLKQMLDRYQGNKALALAAYNAGPGRTDKANGAVPEISETIGYVSKILSNIPLF